MAKTILYVLGAVLVAVGILGFVNDPVLGIFEVDTLHNLVHLATGLVFLGTAAFAAGSVRLVAQIFGVVYAVVAVAGLAMSGDMILGLIQSNLADDILHVLLAVVLLWVGFMARTESVMSAPMNTGGPM